MNPLFRDNHVRTDHGEKYSLSLKVSTGEWKIPCNVDLLCSEHQSIP